MYNGQIINQLLKKQNRQKKELCQFIGSNNSGIEAIINGNPTIVKLEKIADFFKVPIDTFFIREVEIPHILIDAKDYNEEIASILKKLLEEKERTIQLLLKQANRNDNTGANTGQSHK